MVKKSRERKYIKSDFLRVILSDAYLQATHYTDFTVTTHFK